MKKNQANSIFENLFVLEAANNHLGNLDRGLKIIRDHGQVARYNNIKAAIKLQFRNPKEFVHPDFRGNQDLRYIKKTESTYLSNEQYARLIQEIKSVGAIPMATPFDEDSVDLCVAFNMPIIKIASSDMNDWPLINKIASTRLPVIVSSGGASEKDMDDLVVFFARRNIPLALNHCGSLYPSEDSELNLDQIDYFKQRYPDNVIGFSSHEYTDWFSSMLISYGKGARTWERHIDIDYEAVPVSKYNSLPEQCDQWYKAFHKAQAMCGGNSQSRRVISKKETEYLDALVRGAYARRDLEPGYMFTKDNFTKDFYLSIPLRRAQLSCREVMDGEKLIRAIRADEPLTIDHIDGPYSENAGLKSLIMNRGI